MGHMIICKVVCSYCGKLLETREQKPSKYALELLERGEEVISHGICDPCKEKALEEIRNFVKEDTCTTLE